MSALVAWSDDERTAFRRVLSVLPTGRIGRAGVDYEVVCDLCEAHGLVRPSQMSDAMRVKLVERLLTDSGRAALSAAAAERVRLTEAVKDHHRSVLVQAARDAGLVHPKSGKPRTAPSDLSSREMRLLLAAIPSGGVIEHPPGRQRCGDCGLRMHALSPRCPKCGSSLVEREAA